MKTIRLFLLPVLCGLSFHCAAFTLRNGILHAGETPFPLHVFDRSWNAGSQNSSAFETAECSGGRLRGTLRHKNLPQAEFDQNFRKAGDGTFRYDAKVNFASPARLSGLALAANLPIDRFCGRELSADGKKIVLPPEFAGRGNSLLFRGEAEKLILPLEERVLTFEGKFQLTIQDNREWNRQSYSIRIFFTPGHGEVTESELHLKLTSRPYRSTPLDLREAVNMGFADKTAEDGAGGWTDQGPENDLSMLKPGRVKWSGIEFDLIDPERNGGRSCLMLSGFARPSFPAGVEIKTDPGSGGKYLYLLHAVAWSTAPAETGTVTVTYRDGSTSVHPIRDRRDVGNWWAPVPLSRADVVWTGENAASYVGLYRTCIPLRGQPVTGIEFRSAGNAVWGIVAATLSDDAIPRRQSTPFYLVEGKEWRPVEYFRDVEPGSALDFSGRLDAPAGKYGPVMVDGDKLVFRDRPGEAVRFYGTNLCSSAQFLDREWAERLSGRLAAAGYNAVRLHHQDSGLTRREGATTRLNPEMLDRLDYLIACFKKRGIYITTDLYVSRKLSKGELPELPGEAPDLSSFKALIFVLDSAMENYKEFARNWLTHINPYTGLALKDEPALIALCLINEGNLHRTWNQKPFVAEIYEKRFAEWQADGMPASLKGRSREVRFAAFLNEIYGRGIREIRQFVRDLGVTCPLTDQNMLNQPLLAPARSTCDYVDNHFYWAHPSFPETPWQLPSAHNPASAIARQGEAPGKVLPTRIFGKPFLITEFDFARPNQHRAEGAVLTGAYGALQGWNGLFHFAYAHDRDRVMNPEATAGHFDSSTDVVKALSHRIGAQLFRSGRLTPSSVAVPVILDGGEGMHYGEEYSEEIRKLGLVARVGTVVGKEAPPESAIALLSLGHNFAPPPESSALPLFEAPQNSRNLLEEMIKRGVLKKEWCDPARGYFRNPEGTVVLDAGEETFRVSAPDAEVLILPAGKQGISGCFTVENRIGRAVFAALSLDGAALAHSKRILLLHLTDSGFSKTKFSNNRQEQLMSWGTTPCLVARGAAEIGFRPASGVKIRVFALDTAGRRLFEVPTRKTGETAFSFRTEISTPKGQVLVYEILTEPESKQ
ncbi:MAG: hypothetical protein HPZ91_08205 [Lentisphaeria bacterium]|nr:hypothetical protein [Lentisphaeria bacterium]